ncbi:protein FAR1-RELATED SEQUENCE 9-like [Arachis ipaensis]|uniref:protein FAR1-RELATED SEQUENCE 9-like n=1 Tax=Arachis ipaensis TaxID=130454 RepID=UPI0007AF7338|nr:protein FAR1-RELATED SEQUENCE 9-like [Arachis ipaensis]XP_025670320.1 protein FAR1-RELATED SEQUENCE 9-like [Arachis hypogaea]
MWVPIYFKGEFWAAMRSTQRSESMHTFYGGFLHSKTSLVQLVHEYDNVLGVKEQRELEDDAADLGGVSVVDEQGPLVWMKMEEEKLVNDTILYVPYDVYFDRSTQEVHCECNLFESLGVLCCHCLEVFHSYKVYKVPTCYVLPRWSKKIKRKHRYVKSSHDVSRSDESHVAFRGLCAHFYNVAKEFVGDDDETALLHAAMEEIRAKLAAHRAKKRSESVSETQTSFGSQSLNVVNIDNIQGPSKVTTKGRPKSKRVSAALEKPFKNSSRRNHKNSTPYYART